MCRAATICIAALTASLATFAQSPSPQLAPVSEWRRLGGSTLELGIGSPASGPVEKVWYSSDGSTLYARAANGSTWYTSDFEHWTTAAKDLSAIPDSSPGRASELTHLPTAINFKQSAVSPRDPEELAVASAQGVWRTTDGGASWAGLNAGLPNFSVSRIVSVSDAGAVRCLLDELGEVSWEPGERLGWRLVDSTVPASEVAGRAKASRSIAGEVTAFAQRNTMAYAGTADGRLLTSTDGLINWRVSATAATSEVLRINVDSSNPGFAVAITSSGGAGRVLRTLTAGVVWEDLTADLTAAKLQGVAWDRASGTVYIATNKGVYQKDGDSRTWHALWTGNAIDVALDPAGNQLYIASEKEGVFAGLAPHRFKDPRVVSAADRIARAVAPGSLITLLGAKVDTARSGQLSVPILASNRRETEIQIPFDASGTTLALTLSSESIALQRTLPLRPTAPAIFVDGDGNPLLLDGENGLMLDAGTPGRPGARVQILATGLGRVTPSWPSGLPAPLQDPPKVFAPIRVFLDQEPVEVLRATLAPGYTGMYLVEIRLPAVLNPGTSDLYIEAEAEQSNRVRLWLQP